MKKWNWKNLLPPPMLVALLFASCSLIQEMPQDFVETYGNIAYVEKVDYVGLAEDVENGKPAKVTQTKNFKIIYSIRNDGNFDLSPEFTFEGCEIKNPHVDTEKKRVSLTVPGEELKALADGADFKVKLTLYKASQKVLQSAYELGMRYVRTDGPEISKGTVKISLSLPEGYTLVNVKSKDGGEFEVKKGEDGSYTIVAKEEGGLPEGKYELELVVKDEKTGEEVTINKEIEVSGGETTGGFTGEPDDKPFEITTETIEDKKKDVVYVRGTGGCYASKYPDAKEGDDVNNSGTLLSPFATIQKAIDTVIERNEQDEAANPSYTIYIDGTLERGDTTYAGAKGMADFSALGEDLKLTIRALPGTAPNETQKATLNANQKSRVMYAKPNSGKLDLTLENLIITGGNASSANGGGIYFDGSDSKFKMEGCTVKGSEATNGGGIYLNSGTLELNDCTVGGENESDKNDATTGAGIYVTGGMSTFEMTGGKISKNKATSVGGGIYITGSKEANISGTTISGNTATTDGGGVYVTGCELTMNGTITNNTAQQGGGVYVRDNTGVFTMTGGEINGNHTTEDSANGNENGISGGGIFIYGGGKAKISDTTISNNTSNNNGGGIHINGGTLTIKAGTTISGNTAENYGGGVYANATLNMNGGTISGNTAKQDGGGVYKLGGTFTMKGGIISGNTAQGDNGGGICLSGGTFTMDTMGGSTSIISGNNSSFGGGVQINNDGVFTMIKGTISENNANGNGTVGGGGGVHIYKGKFNMTGGTISGNKCTINTEGSGGGGVYVHTGQKFTMSGGTISGNTAAKDGGGVYSNNGIFEMKGDSAISTNTAEYGGGVYLMAGENTFTMSGGEISGNTANMQGGGVYVNSTTFSMSGTAKVNGNTATDSGGGIYVYKETADAVFTMDGGEISGNTATNGNGGGVYNKSGTFTMNGGTIGGDTDGDKNTAQSGGGVYLNAGANTFKMSGGEISGNKASAQGGGVYVNSTTFSMSGSAKVNGNTATDSGGGIYVYKNTADAKFVMACSDEGEISRNTATNVGGGGIYNQDGDATIHSGTISGNKATKSNGGGVYSYKGTFTMNGGTIGGDTTSDKNEAQYGGGVYVYVTTFTMYNGEIINNKGTQGGGGLYLNAGSFKMEGGTFSGNSANVGKGAYIGGASSSTFEMKGDANFDKDNDVYLSGTNTIKIADTLNKDFVATITPLSYPTNTETRQVLSAGTGVTINQTVCDKFLVTPQTDGTKWKVAPNGSTAGVLKKDNVDVGGSGGISVTIPGVGSYTFKLEEGSTEIVEGSKLSSGTSIKFSEVKDSSGKALTSSDGTFSIEIRDEGGNTLTSATGFQCAVAVPVVPPIGMKLQIYAKVVLKSGIVIDKTISVTGP